MTAGVGATILVILVLTVVAVVSAAIGQLIQPMPDHFTDCRHILDLVNGHWQHVWVCRS